MGTTTPNISIYVPAAGETNYDQAFLAGMLNVDGHNHTGGPDNGVVLGAASIADGSITGIKLNDDVAGAGLVHNAGTHALDIAAGGVTNAMLVNSSVTIDGTVITLGTPVVNPIWPSRSMFSAYLTANQVNATGDGTTFNVPFNATDWNQGGSFGGGFFTAPVAGHYLFTYQVTFRGLTNAHDYGLTRLVTTARSYDSNIFNYGAIFANNGSTQVTVSASFAAVMGIGDTASLQVFIADGAKVVTVAGTDPLTTFQGYLIG